MKDPQLWKDFVFMRGRHHQLHGIVGQPISKKRSYLVAFGYDQDEVARLAGPLVAYLDEIYRLLKKLYAEESAKNKAARKRKHPPSYYLDPVFLDPPKGAK